MSLDHIPLAQLRRLAYAKMIYPRVVERERLEDNLLRFVKATWSSFDPSGFQGNWALDALCEHLQAVTDGQLTRLLVNFPPRAAKTNIASICWPAWTWARRHRSYLSGPQVRFLCGSYNDTLSLQNSTFHRRLLLSKFYQKHWGGKFKIQADQNTKSNFANDAGGARLSTSARGSLLGIGGDVVLIDDPHNTTTAESEAERLQALNWWREISTTRLNDPKQSAIVVIMQRLHEEDVSGVILGSETSEWTHLCIPMEYEWRRHCVTGIGWQDPRGLDDDGRALVVIEGGDRLPRDTAAQVELEAREGELMWPERFGPDEIRRIKAELGPYMASGRLQQQPMPAKGGIFDRAWWQVYEPAEFGFMPNKFPPFEYIVASLDSAFTAEEQNDPSALTIWGVFSAGERIIQMGNEQMRAGAARRIMLIHAWRKHLPFSGPRMERGSDETQSMYAARTQADWGLMEWLWDGIRRYKVERLLIEAKASGISAAQELRNRFRLKAEAIELVTPKGDKLARALSVQPMFSQGLIYVPNKEWAFGEDGVVTEMARFPMGRYDDYTDSACQALRYLRGVGLGEMDDEADERDMDAARHRSPSKPLYPGMTA